MKRLAIVLLLLAACGDAAVPASIETTTSTEPPIATEPPITEPPATEPPATEPPATEPPATVVDVDEVIVEVHRGGGLCVDGPCSTTWKVFADGRVEVSDGDPFVIADADLAALRSELAVGFGELPPFTDTCPAAYDGPQFTYTVGATVVDSCVSDVSGSELVRLIDTALFADY
jgi:hypothetical protein